ncbi:MAG: toxin secretion, membrane fusion protein [Crocosphaera sp.]
MEIIYQKIPLKEQKNDFAYWQTQSYQKRLETLEKIRQDYHQWKSPNVQPRLQRVYTISQRS